MSREDDIQRHMSAQDSACESFERAEQEGRVGINVDPYRHRRDRGSSALRRRGVSHAPGMEPRPTAG
jgi:hypothetical protein